MGLLVYRTNATQLGIWGVADTTPQVEVGFFGRHGSSELEQLVARAQHPLRVARLEQVHSAIVRRARDGSSGEGDSLYTAAPRLALAIATADCVPVLIQSGGYIAAVHAGWRGLALGVVGATLGVLPCPPITAWVGPAIGPCCYEVGDDVASRVAAASSSDVVVAGTDAPHLDLARAAAVQLRSGGCRDIRTSRRCTRCDGDRWWSYRRDGPKAGRNWALIWLTATPAGG